METVKAGELVKNDNGRWEFEWRKDDGIRRVHELSCGSVVEIRAFGHWLRGRIEHSPRRGYFFLCPDTGAALELGPGLEARHPQ